MSEKYYPRSEFLRSIIADDILLNGNQFADRNLACLIEITRDPNVSNRDWATFLLSQTEIDTPEIRSALLEALQDPNSVIRGEALCGLAQRDKQLALPLIKRELMGDDISTPTLDAAEELADPELALPLREWLNVDPTDLAFTACVRSALAACENIDDPKNPQLSA